MRTRTDRHRGEGRRGRVIFYLVVVLLLLAGIGAAAYPALSNAYLEKHGGEVYTDYEQSVKKTSDEEIERALTAAADYNSRLALGGGLPEGYEDLLNLAGDGMMGYVVVPSISLKVPIRHGVAPQTLEIGAGHMVGSSLPVGGEGTHTVITAHSGMPGQKMFSDLPALEIGDLFYLEVLGRKLVYEVVQILTVLPEQTDALNAEPGKDLCTLVTCTPFGVNTHRLLVRGTRVSEDRLSEEEESGGGAGITQHTSTWETQYKHYLFIGLAIFFLALLALLLVLLICRIVQRRKEKRTEKKEETETEQGKEKGI